MTGPHFTPAVYIKSHTNRLAVVCLLGLKAVTSPKMLRSPANPERTLLGQYCALLGVALAISSTSAQSYAGGYNRGFHPDQGKYNRQDFPDEDPFSAVSIQHIQSSFEPPGEPLAAF